MDGHGALADVFLEKLACKHYYAWFYFSDKNNGRIFVDLITYTHSFHRICKLYVCTVISVRVSEQRSAVLVSHDRICSPQSTSTALLTTMSTHSRDYGKSSSFKREHDDNDHQRRKGDNEDRHGRPDRRHGTNQRRENPRRDGERRRDRRDYPEDRRSYGREYDDRRRGDDRELDSDRDRASRRDRDGDRDYQTRNDRHRESSRDRARRSRRSASPKRRSQSPARSKSPADKAKPNFNPSGLLAAATNTVKAADGTSTVLKYNEPPEARKPTLGWRLYVFKGSEQTGDFVVAFSCSGL